ncbi:hypothetical protein J6590_077060 [Homalodisca vitripennis]|nr:hypothetical protein J6590_077060 [Homalodisca vitripennis]
MSNVENPFMVDIKQQLPMKYPPALEDQTILFPEATAAALKWQCPASSTTVVVLDTSEGTSSLNVKGKWLGTPLSGMARHCLYPIVTSRQCSIFLRHDRDHFIMDGKRLGTALSGMAGYCLYPIVTSKPLELL